MFRKLIGARGAPASPRPSVLTRPATDGQPVRQEARVAQRQEHVFPSALGIMPVFGFQDQSPLRPVRDNETVNDVMQLTAVTAILNRDKIKPLFKTE